MESCVFWAIEHLCLTGYEKSLATLIRSLLHMFSLFWIPVHRLSLRFHIITRNIPFNSNWHVISWNLFYRWCYNNLMFTPSFTWLPCFYLFPLKFPWKYEDGLQGWCKNKTYFHLQVEPFSFPTVVYPYT